MVWPYRHDVKREGIELHLGDPGAEIRPGREEVVAALLGEEAGIVRHTLPAERNLFVGRKAELVALDRDRPAGAGKNAPELALRSELQARASPAASDSTT